MKTALILLITSLYGVEAPVSVNAVELKSHGTFSDQACNAAITADPAPLINVTGANIHYETSGVCIDTVADHDATHYLSLSLQTIYEGYGVQVSDAITAVPFDSIDACNAALEQSKKIIPLWAQKYSVLSGKCSPRS